MPQLQLARRRCSRHPPDHHIPTLGLWVEQAQVGHQLVILPAHQVQGIAGQVLAIDFLVGAALLDHEHFSA